MIRPAIGVMLAALLTLTGCQGSEKASAVEAVQKEHIVDVALPVQNRPDASGAEFLATMVEQYKGADDKVSVTSRSSPPTTTRRPSTSWCRHQAVTPRRSTSSPTREAVTR